MGDLLQLIDGVLNQLPPFYTLLGAIAFFVGVWLIVSAIRDAARHNEGGAQGGWAPPLVKLIIGILLFSFPQVIMTLTGTFFGTNDIAQPSQIFSMAPDASSPFHEGSVSGEVVVAILTIVQFIGFIAVFRGLLLINANFAGVGQRPALGSGITHLIGGIAAVNMPIVIALFENLAQGGSS